MPSSPTFGSLPTQYTHNGYAYFGDGTTHATGYGRVVQGGLEIGIGVKPRQQDVVDAPDSMSFDNQSNVETLNYALPAGPETTPNNVPNRGANSLEYEVSGRKLAQQLTAGSSHQGDVRGASEVDFIFTDSHGAHVEGYFGADPTANDPYHLGVFDKSTHQLLIGDDGDNGTPGHEANTTQNSTQANFFDALGVASLTAGSSYDLTIEQVGRNGHVNFGVHTHVDLV